MSAAVEWGVPDWLSPAEYPTPQGPGEMVIWAWEFLRRNPQYRKFWDEKFAPFVSSNGMRWNSKDGMKEVREEFGISEPCDPRQSNRTAVFAALSTRFVPAPLETYELLHNRPAKPTPGNPFRPATMDDWEELSKELRHATFELSDTECAFVVDLEQPLDGQLKRIAELAKESQAKLAKAQLVTLRNARARSDAYVGYLRLLDAIDSGANRLVIEETLFPNLDGTYGNDQRGKKYDNDLRAACGLRARGYRGLATIAY